MEKRVWGLDVIKTIALVLVVAIHSITLSNLVDSTFNTIFWFPTLVLRSTALSCVPLFIIVTGFLQKDKEISLGYYGGIIPVLVSYLIISALSSILKLAVGDTTSIIKAVLHIFDFTANGYAWYVEMYIGLFAVIPFLNLLYKSLDKKQRFAALIVIIAVTMLPQAFSSIGLSSFRLSVLPDYWDAAYPVGYYFIGVFLAEMKPHIKKLYNAFALVIWILLMSAVCFVFSYLSGQYAWWFANGFGCLYNAVTAVLIFLLFYDIDVKEGKFKNAVSLVASITLEAYLFSYITDKVIYKLLALPMPFMTLISLIGSVILALILRKITSPLSLYLKNKFNEFVMRKYPQKA